MANGRPVISHVVIACFDFPKMVEYYTKTLGFYLSDIGTVNTTQLCFLTFDPEAEHHQIALTGGRQGAPGDGAIAATFIPTSCSGWNFSDAMMAAMLFGNWGPVVAR